MSGRLCHCVRHRLGGTAWRGCAVGLLFLAHSYALAADDSISRDIWHTVLARAELRKDADLAPLNSGVRVQSRIARLWGPVPSAALADRAVARLQAMHELRGVRNELTVDDAWNAANRRSLFLPDHAATATSSKPEEPKADGPQPVGPHAEGPPAPLPEIGRISVGGTPPSAAKRDKHTPATILTIGPSGPAPAQTAKMIEEGKALTWQPHAWQPRTDAQPRTDGQTLAKQVHDLQRQNATYAELKVEVRGGILLVRGPIYQSEALHRLANQISKLPGVERVIVQEQ